MDTRSSMINALLMINALFLVSLHGLVLFFMYITGFDMEKEFGISYLEAFLTDTVFFIIGLHLLDYVSKKEHSVEEPK